ncbi:MAG: bifunctional adenosylcobinamide kinase/adenosylcobinamide-phosphate guanylyltransferase [Proteobacteria bacterium]|nr:bifunctional adenosylcobinamide kinase/adenosylcobinamide-phosphate guanylyltransferase [Pseudomonadota bacterium]
MIGAAYTGKSELAIRTLQPELSSLVIGTADLSEGLLAARVAELRRQRPSHWQHLEGVGDLGEQLQKSAPLYPQILLDSINQWVANLLLTRCQKYSLEQLTLLCEKEMHDFVHSLQTLRRESRIIMVSSEVGAGITPPKPIARLFRQMVSRINCRLAEQCESVLLVSAGIPLLIKGEWPEAKSDFATVTGTEKAVLRSTAPDKLRSA